MSYSQHLLLLLFLTLMCISKGNEGGSVGIFIHGCNVESEGWDRIVWGEVSDNPEKSIHDWSGRMVRAAEVVEGILFNNVCDKNMNLQSIMWGSGLELPDKFKEEFAVCREGQYTRSHFLHNFDQLRNYKYFRHLSTKRFERLRGVMTRLSITDDISHNTVTELHACLEHFKNKKIDIVLLVSSATHAPRCIKEASTLMMKIKNEAVGGEWDPMLCVIPSETCYHGTNAEDVFIFEPPHIPRDVEFFHSRKNDYALIQRWMKLSGDDKLKFSDRLDNLLTEFE